LFYETKFRFDRGSECENELVDDVITTFGIKRYLSMKDCLCDNVATEVTFNIYN